MNSTLQVLMGTREDFTALCTEKGSLPIKPATDPRLLSDEEIIMLAKNGKIAVYALEKCFEMDELEHAHNTRSPHLMSLNQ
ncbi:hypothetical protein DFP72DRAFT_1072435 [Ephemerocybe angulata]|uniref:Uncharacterized protein n=1 Tax=Ephemerocybe angulata TaxID=980116 RepID=A0A8H6HQD1_9AGAR|nr:hypothetical protein DFP72DRAFT_1072435 [Tulosesus angulatus]